MIRARASNEPTQQEIQVFEKFCLDHNIVTDGAAGEQNVLTIAEFVIDRWKVEVTEDALEIALQKLGEAGRLTFYTPAQAQYRKIAAENIDRANQLNQWFHSYVNTSLVKDGDQGLQNQTVLLAELRGRDIGAKTIQEAIGRASHRSGLHFVPTPRKENPLQHKDTGSFMPKETNARYRGGKLNHAYKEPGTRQATPKAYPTDVWETLCKQMLNHGTHSQQAAFHEIYDQAVAQGISYRHIYAEMTKLKASHERVIPRGF